MLLCDTKNVNLPEQFNKSIFVYILVAHLNGYSCAETAPSGPLVAEIWQSSNLSAASFFLISGLCKACRCYNLHNNPSILVYIRN